MKIKNIQIGKQKYIPDVVLESDSGDSVQNRELENENQISLTYRLATEAEKRKWISFRQVQKKIGGATETIYESDKKAAIKNCVLEIENLTIDDEAGKSWEIKNGEQLSEVAEGAYVLLQIQNQIFDLIIGAEPEKDEPDFFA